MLRNVRSFAVFAARDDVIVDPEFTKLLVRVLIVGSAIGLIGAGVLFFAFRAFAPATTRDRDFRATLLVTVLLAFVLLCCVVLLRLSILK